MPLSLPFLKKSPSPEGGPAAPAPSPMRNRAMILVAVLGLGVVGYKMFWPESAPVKAAAGLAKTGSAAKPGAKPTAKPKGSAVGNNTTPRPAPTAKPKPKPAPAAPPPGSAPGEETEIPTPAEMKQPPPKASPAPAPGTGATAQNEILAPAFVDEINGFSIRFPHAWAIRTFASEPWVLDCGDGRTALISIGFSAFPADFTAENIPPEWVARRIKKRNDTTLHSQGYALIGGKKALWSKSTGPLPMTNGNPRMTRVNYIIPLHDGRVMELRIATTPELFDQLMPTMRQSVESFRFIPRATAAPH